MNQSRPKLSVSILDTKRITPAEWDGYQSFPTITKVNEDFLVGFRRAVNIHPDLRGVMDHGMAGDIYTTRSTDDGLTFEKPNLVISHATDKTNEHDALVTVLDAERVAMITRTHTSELRRNYFSLSTDGGKSFPQRRPLDPPGGEWASFGHFIPSQDKSVFIGTFYNGTGCGTFRLNPETLEISHQSFMFKHTANFRMNETSITRLKSGRILAMIRQQPCYEGIFKSHSDDEGLTWSTPVPVGLYGEAPALLLLPNGNVLMIYRGMIRKNRRCRVALSLSKDGGETWSHPQTLAWYKGGRFHGGYGDLALNSKGQIIAVYYISRKHEAPTVERMILEVNQ
ncbi:BNR repeat-like domain-containing protein [Maridesulfovibrio ferrireducens]|uniref:BNR repeat-like domain-containing protein n=1 Tax=Maridesulfovibrio ferrireducens TaxID=246191 RepID=A0A1G9B5H6_9BACT|nr:sialidase family protein [Maridesulfovibrio ferrireducens]SDK34753.1 BNR repeat-like domain-containing protein [Maridesulfovibrio ferrireducens]